MSTPLDEATLLARFTYHAPDATKIELHQRVRQAGLSMARELAACAPPSGELEMGLRAVESAVMWANAAIARQPSTLDQDTLFSGLAGGA